MRKLINELKSRGHKGHLPSEKEPELWLDIDDVSIPMNPFVQKIFTQILMGMICSLEGIPKDPKCITLSLSRKGKKDEKI